MDRNTRQRLLDAFLRLAPKCLKRIALVKYYRKELRYSSLTDFLDNGKDSEIASFAAQLGVRL